MRTSFALSVVALAALACPAANASRMTQAYLRDLSPSVCWFPSTNTGRIFPAEWVMAAGEVVGYSPDLQEDAAPPTKRRESWIRVRVVKPIARTKTGDIITIYFRQPQPARQELSVHSPIFTDVVKLAGGEELLVQGTGAPSKLHPFKDIYPLSTYEDDRVKALQEYARWDTLTGQAQLEAIAAAVRQTGNKWLRGYAPGFFAGRAVANRSWAFGVLSAIARDSAGATQPSSRVGALMACNALYKTDEPGGLSGQILSLYGELLRCFGEPFPRNRLCTHGRSVDVEEN